MLLGVGIIIVGVLLLLLGVHSFKKTKGDNGTIIDIFINGFQSGLGQIIASILFIDRKSVV